MLEKNYLQLITLSSFIILIAWTISHKSSRSHLRTKTCQDWLLDGSGLAIQGIFMPLLQALLFSELCQHLTTDYQGCLKLSLIPSFILSFVMVDYLYYWNHRLLHLKLFWPVHQVHHTVNQMDVFGTSRNTIWTSFLIIYLWINPLFLYLLAKPTGYLLGVSLTSALDLWRHSRLLIAPNSCWAKLLSPWLILPEDHAWHHGRETRDYNYGANLKIWDKFHGTYYQCQESPSALGITTSLNLMQKLFFPFL
jgi:sterol desaturase/sphingolipid hydroxylase (fatty acid hydroxylase superfamily)